MAVPNGRFAGQEFPPFIVLKIFRSTQGQGSKYISGKRTSPSNEAAADVCKLMGYQKYHEQMAQNELQYPNHRITDDNDTLLQIWLRRFPLLQGRVVSKILPVIWMKALPTLVAGITAGEGCPLQNFPRTMIICAIMDYAQSKTL